MKKTLLFLLVFFCLILTACNPNEGNILGKLWDGLNLYLTFKPAIDRTVEEFNPPPTMTPFIDMGDLLPATQAEDIPPTLEPILTLVARDNQPAPIPAFTGPITDYFAYATSPDCKLITNKVNDIDPLQSIGCNQEKVIVRYDYWDSIATMDEVHNSLMSSPETQVTKSSGWFNDQNPDEMLGKFYAFLDEHGTAHIVWTVTSENLSGWAMRADGDQDALYHWWSETASEQK